MTSELGGAGSVHYLGRGADQRDELGGAAQAPRQVAHLHEAFNELGRDLRGIEQDQVDDPGMDVAADGQHTPRRTARPTS